VLFYDYLIQDEHLYALLTASNDEAGSGNASVTVKENGRQRFCQKCEFLKPDRAHHCSICQRCILKMDHHCPWLANCIGFENHKAFVLFLCYLVLFCLLACLMSIIALVKVISDERVSQFIPVQWMLLAVISGVVGLSVLGFASWSV
jgi:hypothetical protein